ncbi:MAG TPA: glycosyltransferase family 4 protein [Rickettsiales bacterium]|nr:glycosyltransferase family 4 protein [Rickettsiales bacterium]
MMQQDSGLHILIANNIYPPIMAGGAELIVQYLAEGLAKRGNRVTVVSTCGPEMEPYPVETRNGVEVIRFFPKNLYWHWTRGKRPGWQKALWHLRDAWNLDAGKRFNAILQERKPDVVHSHLIDGLSAAIWRRAREHNIPVVHTAHDYHLLCPRSVLLDRSLKICTKPKAGCRVFRSWHLSTARDVNLFCSPSQFLLEKHKESGLAVAQTAVVPNGIPLPAPVVRQREAGAVRRFLFAARMTPEKGCQVLLDAVKLLPPEVKFELCVAGKGELEPAFHEAAASDSRIRLLGYIQGEEKTATFRAADCLILPSLWYENAPVVIVEAAAYGIGVIGSNIGAIPEFVAHEKTGLLFEPGNPASLAQAMRRFIDDDALPATFAQNAQQLVERSSVEQMVEGYLKQYRKVIAGNKKE